MCSRSDVDGERDGGVGLQLFRRDELVVASSPAAARLRPPAVRLLGRRGCGAPRRRRPRRRRARRAACRPAVPPLPARPTRPRAMRPAATAGAANLNQRIWLHGYATDDSLIADCARCGNPTSSRPSNPDPRAAKRRSAAVALRQLAPRTTCRLAASGPERIVDALGRLQHVERVEILHPLGDVAAEIEDAVGVGVVAADRRADGVAVVVGDQHRRQHLRRRDVGVVSGTIRRRQLARPTDTASPSSGPRTARPIPIRHPSATDSRCAAAERPPSRCRLPRRRAAGRP